jgi:hypothetical protein
MRPRKYPLEPLVRLKKERVESTTRQLGKAVLARESAERRHEEAASAQRQGDARASRVRTEERDLLEKGELSAADLIRANAWEVRVQTEGAERAHAVDAAQATMTTQRRRELDAQAEVARSRGEAKAVDRHEARWIAAREKVREAEEEEATSEAARPKPLR